MRMGGGGVIGSLYVRIPSFFLFLSLSFEDAFHFIELIKAEVVRINCIKLMNIAS